MRASTHKRHGKASGAGETPSGCDWQYNWNAGQAIEFTQRYDEHRPLALLLVTSGWTAATGKEPPANPEDPEVSWPEAVGWAVASGALIGVARLVATRKAAAYYTKSAGHPPKRLRKVT